MTVSHLAGRAVLCSCLYALAFSFPANAEDAREEISEQIRANLVLSLPKSEILYLEYDIEAAGQVSDGAPWRYFYGTGLLELYPSRFVDLTGELSTGLTRQSLEEDSFEATVRLGLRLNFIYQIFNSPLIEKIRPERMSGRRFTIANLARIEQRNFWYSGQRPSEHDLRFRNRVETKLAINKTSLSEDNLWYLVADAEWFVPLNSEVAAERFATKFRTRAGLGYRRSYRWRFEVLAIKDDAKDTLGEEFEVDAYNLNLKAKWFF